MMTNKMLLLYIVVITVLSDVFAYLVGSKIGKRHFTKISPTNDRGLYCWLNNGNYWGSIILFIRMIDAVLIFLILLD